MAEKRLLSPALRAFIEGQLERLEKAADLLDEATAEFRQLYLSYIADDIEALTEYAQAYGFYDEPKKVEAKNKKTFFMIEPIKTRGKINLDSFGIRCIVYRRGRGGNFLISEQVFNLQELKQRAKKWCLDVEGYNEAKELFEKQEWKQGER